MALLESLMIPLGTTMPEFVLQDPTGTTYDSKKLMGPKGLLINFTCNHCPYALAVWPRFIRLAKMARQAGIYTVAINPNIHPKYPEDAPQKMQEKIKEWGIDFPYLVDASQDIARAFKAQCTPDLYLFTADQKLVYHGRIDDNWQDEGKVRSEDLKTAIEQLAAGQPILAQQCPSMGCSIKWRAEV